MTGASGQQRSEWEELPSRQKTMACLRLLRGEDLDVVSRDLGVSPAVLAHARDRFLAWGLLRSLLPSPVKRLAWNLQHRLTSHLEKAPGGWEVVGDSKVHGWDVESVVTATKAEWDRIASGGEGMTPLERAQHYNLHSTFAYVVAVAAWQKRKISVLDWGAGLGHYASIARAALPWVAVEYSCKEVPSLVQAGRELFPEIHWFSDEQYEARRYDLVVASGSLQYVRDLAAALRGLAGAVKNGGLFYLARLPIVERSATFPAIQRSYGSRMLHWVFNRLEVLEIVAEQGLCIVREFDLGERHPIRGSREDCKMWAGLFKKSDVSEVSSDPVSH